MRNDLLPDNLSLLVIVGTSVWGGSMFGSSKQEVVASETNIEVARDHLNIL